MQIPLMYVPTSFKLLLGCRMKCGIVVICPGTMLSTACARGGVAGGGVFGEGVAGGGVYVHGLD